MNVLFIKKNLPNNSNKIDDELVNANRDIILANAINNNINWAEYHCKMECQYVYFPKITNSKSDSKFFRKFIEYVLSYANIESLINLITTCSYWSENLSIDAIYLLYCHINSFNNYRRIMHMINSIYCIQFDKSIIGMTLDEIAKVKKIFKIYASDRAIDMWIIQAEPVIIDVFFDNITKNIDYNFDHLYCKDVPTEYFIMKLIDRNYTLSIQNYIYCVQNEYIFALEMVNNKLTEKFYLEVLVDLTFNLCRQINNEIINRYIINKINSIETCLEYFIKFFNETYANIHPHVLDTNHINTYLLEWILEKMIDECSARTMTQLLNKIYESYNFYCEDMAYVTRINSLFERTEPPYEILLRTPGYIYIDRNKTDTLSVLNTYRHRIGLKKSAYKLEYLYKPYNIIRITYGSAGLPFSC